MSTDTRTVVGSDQPWLSLEYAVVVLAAVSGLIHLYEGLEDYGEGVLPILFLLAGVGFFVWIALLVLGMRGRWIYAAGFLFTAIQFVAYFLLRWPQVFETIGLVDKAVQLVLLFVLVAVYRRKR